MVGETVEIISVHADSCQFAAFASFEDPVTIVVKTYQIYGPSRGYSTDRLLYECVVPVELPNVPLEVLTEAHRQINRAIRSKEIWDTIVNDVARSGK